MKIPILRILTLLCLIAGPAWAQQRIPPVAPVTPPAVISPAPPVMPVAPPAAPAIPPPIVVPVRPPPPPPALHVAPDAPGGSSALPDGLRITFGPDRAELNPTTERAVRALVHTAPADARFNLVASAAGKADDASAVRRLSLSRGLNIRAVLINEGVAANRILLRALAAPPAGEDQPDRVDIAVQPKAGG